ncbi:uncharacterized protein LOC144701087 isoform X2 [Wolffia australiana]
MATNAKTSSLRALFIALDFIVISTVAYTLITDGWPFRKEVLTPWMVTTLLDFYINIVPVAIWIFCNESSWVLSGLWIILLLCLGSMVSCTYILLQLFKCSPHDSNKEPIYRFLPNQNVRNTNQSQFSAIVVGRIVFVILGCLMVAALIYTSITDGSPFRKELLTPWMIALLIDFYVNIAILSLWIAHKETTWMSTVVWILILVFLGSAATCVYVVLQLFKLSPDDPFDRIFTKPESKQP